MFSNKGKYKSGVLIVALCVLFCSVISWLGFSMFGFHGAVYAESGSMPFYDLRPSELRLRAEFFTSYSASSDERKHNIKVAAKALDNVLIDVGAEFSFNYTVGERTEKRGYKKAKIIFNGKFTDGIGGGVCQVSSTLYNAALLAGLDITEFHPHSLPVSYVAPSFDAMVNSGSADLRFVNVTHNPIYIKTFADDITVKISVYGEPMTEKYVRQSRIIQEIPNDKFEVLKDEKGEFPDLFLGDRKIISYGRSGYKSEAVLIKTINGKAVSSKLLRKDLYRAVSGVIIEGTRIKESQETDLP